MTTPPCPACGVQMSASPAEFHNLRGPAVAILDVPGLSCDICGACHFQREVLQRLTIILHAALDHAEEEGLSEVVWDFTPQGPPDLGGLPCAVRGFFACLRDLLDRERQVSSAAEEVVEELPATFH